MAASDPKGTHTTAPATAVPRLAKVPRLAAAVAAPALAVGLLLAGCGSTNAGADSDPDATENGDAEDADTDNGDTEENGDTEDTEGVGDAATELTVEVNIDEDAEDMPADEDEPQTGEWTLTCEPEGGDHPDPEAACADLAEVEVATFEPVDEDQMCTHIYGGPHVASVTGTVDGTEVDANFSREDGCEIDRWDSMGAVLDP